MSDDGAGFLGSGKEWSDRMAERGFQADPRFPRDNYGYGHNSGERDRLPGKEATTSSGSWLWALVVGFGWVAWEILKAVLPIIVAILRAIGSALWSAIFSSKRRRR